MKTEETTNIQRELDSQPLDKASDVAKSPSAFLVISTVIGTLTILFLSVSVYRGLMGS